MLHVLLTVLTSNEEFCKLLREALRETEHSNQKIGEIHGTAADGATYIVLPLAPLKNPRISPHLSTFSHIYLFFSTFSHIFPHFPTIRLNAVLFSRFPCIRDSDEEVEIGMHDVRSFIFVLGLLMDIHAL